MRERRLDGLELIEVVTFQLSYVKLFELGRVQLWYRNNPEWEDEALTRARSTGKVSFTVFECSNHG